MYNKEELISKAKEIKTRYNASFVILVHGSAEVLHGIKELTNDLDVSGDFKGFENIEPSLYGPPYDLWFLEEEDVDIGVVEVLPNNIILVEDGVYYTTIEQLIEDKKKLGREKDKEALVRIEEFLNNSN